MPSKDKYYWVAVLEDGTKCSQIAPDGSFVLSSTLKGLPVDKLEIHGLIQPTMIPVPKDAEIKVFNRVRMTVDGRRVITNRKRFFGYDSPSVGSLYAIVDTSTGALSYQIKKP